MSIQRDRTYWRSCSTKRLTEEARESGHELCIALGERLNDVERAYGHIDDLLEDLDRTK